MQCLFLCTKNAKPKTKNICGNKPNSDSDVSLHLGVFVNNQEF